MRRLALGLLLFSTTALHAVSYRVYDLPALGGSATTTTGAYDISENGWVAGYSGGGSGQRAVRWGVSTSGAWETRNVGVLPSATSSIGYGVDDHGHIVGSSGGQAFAWIPEMYTGLHPIPPPPGAPSGSRCIQAFSINHVDEVVGRYAKLGTSPPYWAFHWRTSEATTLYESYYHRSLGTTAYAINQFGQFVGSAERKTTGTTLLMLQQAYVWQAEPAEPGYLGAFSGQEGNPGWSVAYGLNDHLHVVGESEGQAFVWKPLGTMTSLGVGVARGINNWESIVGYAPGAVNSYAWVKYSTSSTAFDLNTLIPPNSGWTLLEAHGINERGWIIGIGRKTTPTGGLSGEEGEQTIQVVRGFLLIPQ
jgi:hypothetical protein